jgi:hypothetical protein
MKLEFPPLPEPLIEAAYDVPFKLQRFFDSIERGSNPKRGMGTQKKLIALLERRGATESAETAKQKLRERRQQISSGDNFKELMAYEKAKEWIVKMKHDLGEQASLRDIEKWLNSHAEDIASSPLLDGETNQKVKLIISYPLNFLSEDFKPDLIRKFLSEEEIATYQVIDELMSDSDAILHGETVIHLEDLLEKDPIEAIREGTKRLLKAWREETTVGEYDLPKECGVTEALSEYFDKKIKAALSINEIVASDD